MDTYTLLQTIDDLEQLLANTTAESLLIFKHSTACPISARAYAEFLAYSQQRTPPDPQLALVKVIEQRAVSKAIATRFQVTHQSPQVLLIANGKVHWHASHWHITAESIAQAVRQFHQP